MDMRAAPPACGLAAALLALLGCVSPPPESPQQQQADAEIAGRVHAALESDRMHLYIGLDVRVRAGVAYITALTFDPSARDQATEIARDVPGVTRVVNEIEVSAGAAR
jgi:osmotically-inducible protein OsmY